MQRPIMDPTCLAPEVSDARHSTLLPALLKLTTATWRLLRRLGRALLSQPWQSRRRPERTPVGGLAGRVLRGTLYRLLFSPALVALASVALVNAGTHPRSPAGEVSPASAGLYCETLNFTSADGTRLQGWLVPTIDAKRVLRERGRVLSTRHPAIVLAHDFGQSPAQLMPLVQPLHDDGVVVLAVGLRGVGLDARVAQTFGIEESHDVAAAVAQLRENPFVDPARVAVMGIGTGANAALLAADRDPTIAAVLLADPLVNADEAIALRVGPNRWGTRWAQPVTKLTFELIHHADADEINLSRFANLLRTRPVLTLASATGEDGQITPTAVARVRTFCRTDVSAYRPIATAAGR